MKPQAFYIHPGANVLYYGAEPFLVFSSLAQVGVMLTSLGYRASECRGNWVFSK